uniref:Uncharacterized protein n=1 Tax=Oryza meridionalis TaxID=40149 RepID=A0A0E0DFJ1_9ORYZ
MAIRYYSAAQDKLSHRFSSSPRVISTSSPPRASPKTNQFPSSRPSKGAKGRATDRAMEEFKARSFVALSPSASAIQHEALNGLDRYRPQCRVATGKHAAQLDKSPKRSLLGLLPVRMKFD